MNQKRYSYTSKIATLRLLEQNDYCFYRTEKISGIRRQTIKVWAEKYGPDVFSGNSPLEMALDLVEKELKQKELKTINKCMTALEMALEKLIELTKTEKSILKLSRALKVVHEIMIKMEEARDHSLRHPDYI